MCFVFNRTTLRGWLPVGIRQCPIRHRERRRLRKGGRYIEFECTTASDTLAQWERLILIVASESSFPTPNTIAYFPRANPRNSIRFVTAKSTSASEIYTHGNKGIKEVQDLCLQFKRKKENLQSSKNIQLPPIPKQTVGAVAGAAAGSIAGPSALLSVEWWALLQEKPRRTTPDCSSGKADCPESHTKFQSDLESTPQTTAQAKNPLPNLSKLVHASAKRRKRTASRR